MSERCSNDGVRGALIIALLAIAALSVSSWFFLSMGKFTDGALAMPLDDSYIYFQYARNISEGRFFHYSPADEPSTGATSLTYVLVLAGACLMGLQGDSLILFAFVLGTCFLFASAVFTREILKPLSGELVSVGGALLFLLNGHVVWAYLSGMEVGLFATTILLTLLLFQRERQTGRFFGTSVAAALMGLSRPEGFFLAVPVAILVFLVPRERPRSQRFLLAVLCLCSGLQFILNFSLTGSFASTGAQAKSVFHTQEPDVWRDYMARFFQFPWHVLRLFLTDFYSSSFGPRWARVSDLFLSWGFVIAALGFIVARRRRTFLPLLLASWVALSVFLSLIPWAWQVHHHRYQIPFFPVFLIISSTGLGFLLGLVPARVRPLSRMAAAVLLALVLVSFLGSTKRMALQYAHNCENIFRQQVKIGRWIRHNTPSNAIVGLNDAGAITYVGERRAFDFVGIVTANQATNWRSGIGSIVEALERLPEEDLPTLLAIYPNWLPFFLNSGIAKTELFRAHLSLNTICGGTDKVVYLPDWTLLRSGEVVPLISELEQLTLVDSVDVGDIRSEREHDYRPLGKWRSEARVLLDPEGRRVMDGGRRHWLGETMRVRCAPDSPLFVLLRLDDEFKPVTLYVEGKHVGTAAAYESEGSWTYAPFAVPRELVRTREIELTFRLTTGDANDNYAAYHYWFLQ
ncbi:MAG: hypothetical protein AMJ46_04750 [Latescibacteria bacterium DG_63]|nr:MAG: hypothetical protein AMJ46_04750 [Latescibacteria bacterium DG_63]